MSIATIYDDINSEQITFGPHLIQRMWEGGISVDQVLDTILTGTVTKGSIKYFTQLVDRHKTITLALSRGYRL